MLAMLEKVETLEHGSSFFFCWLKFEKMLNISKFVNVTTKQVGLLNFPKMAMGHINFGKILWQIWKIVVPGGKIIFFNYGDRLKAYWKYPYIYVPLLWLNSLELNLSGI